MRITLRSCVPERRFGKSIFFYCFCAVIFSVGFFLGVLQTSGWCNDNYAMDHVHGTMKADISTKQISAYLIVIIFSSPKNYEKRLVIRKTWLLTGGNHRILHFFAIGTASLNFEEKHNLKNELKEYNDLLLLDSVNDSFSKLSEKLREIFRWLDSKAHYTFVLKVDDDSFVRLNALYTAMTKQPQEKLYWGFFNGQANVKLKGKWAEKDWFLCDHYLPYALGGGYVLSADLVHYIVLVSDILSIYQNEDVSLGIWLAPFEIKRLHDPLFDTEFRSRGCFNSYLVTHKQTPSMMIEKYNNIAKTGKLCLSEYRTRNSYVYNWNALPSQCCIRNDTNVP
ncbi:beta-1,3-galactosyltransferase 6-like [Stegodyphus dumicola]|uniref:beta-1,3-galactosyltransferase 6-like n=1 Tax=Stegodyphus dumicola TaxID=202533 RepID=UPI0015A7C4A3|nr:beta-1,3-galactosyltransferase 6-like [Stegodyphus dumicola]